MRRIVAMAVVAWLASAAAGCESAALRYARGVNPGCAVEPLDEAGDHVRVRVTCPGVDPVERTYRSR